MIRWLDWGAGLLERARAERRPVLLFLGARFCRFCAEMERTTFADVHLAEVVARECLPVRVTREDWPDVDARYRQGGWPSTVLLDGQGEVLAGGTFLEAPHLLELVLQAARVCRGEAARQEVVARTPAAAFGRLTGDILPAIERALLADFDERHGGFGAGSKFPHPEALDFAVLRHASARSPRLHEILEKTLSHMAEGGLQDRVEGGFFRYCERRDWSQPHTEKLLETNAGLARNYLEVGQLLGRADYLRLGERTLDALRRDFFDRSVGLLDSGIDPDDDYYALDVAGRATRRRPRRAGRFLADGNARAVSALLKAGAVLGRLDLTHAALAVVENLMRKLWRPGHGVYHAFDGKERHLPGKLRDQSETARTLLHVLQYTDDRRFLPPLEDLVEQLASEHVSASGEFVDHGTRAAPRGPRSDAAILESAVAAEVLLRAALYLGRPSLGELARRALEVHAEDFRRYGYAMAAYGRSVELVLHPPLHVVVVGSSGEPAADALLRAASATYVPSRVVQRLDPARDDRILQRLGLPVPDSATAYVFLARDCAGDFTSAETLRQGLLAAESRRVQG